MVRLAASVVLHAMAARAGDLAEPGNKAIDQRSLANSGLAGDPEYDALATPHAIPGAAQRCKFFCSTDEQSVRRFNCRRARRRRRRLRTHEAALPDGGDSADSGVKAAMNR